MAGNQAKVRETSSAILINITVSAILAVLKIAVGLLSHSMAILASSLDSLMDVGTSFVNLIAFREASKPPDEDHAYGHGKIESLAGLYQSTFIGLSGLYLVFESVRRLIVGNTVQAIPLGILVMAVSSVASWLLVWRMQRLVKKYQSVILSTERLHFATDVLANVGVIAALALVYFTDLVIWDLVLSILVSIYVLKASFEILKRCIDELLDKSLPLASVAEIEKLIRSHHASIIGVHNFRSRRVGDKLFLDFHIEIRGVDDFKRAHDMTEDLIEKIQRRYPGADVTVHFDPEGAR